MKMWDAKPGRRQSLMEKLVRQEMEARHTGETTDFQKRVEDQNTTLATSRFVANAPQIKLRSHWRNNKHDTDQVVRRLLSIALGKAIVKNQNRLGEILRPDWDDGIALAREAHRSLESLINWISQRTEIAQPDARKFAALRVIDTAAGNAGLHPDERALRADRLFQAFSEVHNLIGRMPDEYGRLRQSLVTQNQGEIEKQAFVSTLAEGWDFFFAVKPANSDKSLFNGFILSAWEDIGGTLLEEITDPSGEAQESFTNQRRAEVDARKGKDVLPDEWLPDWFNKLHLVHLRDPRVINLWSHKFR